MLFGGECSDDSTTQITAIAQVSIGNLIPFFVAVTEDLNTDSRWKKGLILAPNSGDGSLMQDLEATDHIHAQEQSAREGACLPACDQVPLYVYRMQHPNSGPGLSISNQDDPSPSLPTDMTTDRPDPAKLSSQNFGKAGRGKDWARPRRQLAPS